MVDASGQIVKYTDAQRLAVNGLLRSRLEMLINNPIPLNHQAHHIVPSNVAQNSPLHQEAIIRELYDVDRVSNGKLLAETAEDFTDAAGNTVSDAHLFPTHNGSHPDYNQEINDLIDDVLFENGISTNQIGNLLDDEIIDMLDDIESMAGDILKNWTSSKLN